MSIFDKLPATTSASAGKDTSKDVMVMIAAAWNGKFPRRVAILTPRTGMTVEIEEVPVENARSNGARSAYGLAVNGLPVQAPASAHKTPAYIGAPVTSHHGVAMYHTDGALAQAFTAALASWDSGNRSDAADNKPVK